MCVLSAHLVLSVLIENIYFHVRKVIVFCSIYWYSTVGLLILLL